MLQCGVTSASQLHDHCLPPTLACRLHPLDDWAQGNRSPGVSWHQPGSGHLASSAGALAAATSGSSLAAPVPADASPSAGAAAGIEAALAAAEAAVAARHPRLHSVESTRSLRFSSTGALPLGAPGAQDGALASLYPQCAGGTAGSMGALLKATRAELEALTAARGGMRCMTPVQTRLLTKLQAEERRLVAELAAAAADGGAGDASQQGGRHGSAALAVGSGTHAAAALSAAGNGRGGGEGGGGSALDSMLKKGYMATLTNGNKGPGSVMIPPAARAAALAAIMGAGSTAYGGPLSHDGHSSTLRTGRTCTMSSAGTLFGDGGELLNVPLQLLSLDDGSLPVCAATGAKAPPPTDAGGGRGGNVAAATAAFEAAIAVAAAAAAAGGAATQRSSAVRTPEAGHRCAASASSAAVGGLQSHSLTPVPSDDGLTGSATAAAPCQAAIAEAGEELAGIAEDGGTGNGGVTEAAAAMRPQLKDTATGRAVLQLAARQGATLGSARRALCGGALVDAQAAPGGGTARSPSGTSPGGTSATAELDSARSHAGELTPSSHQRPRSPWSRAWSPLRAIKAACTVDGELDVSGTSPGAVLPPGSTSSLASPRSPQRPWSPFRRVVSPTCSDAAELPNEQPAAAVSSSRPRSALGSCLCIGARADTLVEGEAVDGSGDSGLGHATSLARDPLRFMVGPDGGLHVGSPDPSARVIRVLLAAGTWAAGAPQVVLMTACGDRHALLVPAERAWAKLLLGLNAALLLADGGNELASVLMINARWSCRIEGIKT